MLEVIRQKYRDCSSLNFLGEIRLQLPFKKCFPQLPQFLSPLLICLVPLWSALPAAIPSSNTSMRDLWLMVLWCRAMASGKVRATKQHRKKKKKKKKKNFTTNCIFYLSLSLYSLLLRWSFSTSLYTVSTLQGLGGGVWKEGKKEGREGRETERESELGREREREYDRHLILSTLTCLHHMLLTFSPEATVGRMMQPQMLGH